MLSEFEKLVFILPARKLFYVCLAIAFISISLLEAVGIGLIGPFIYLASDPERISEIPLLESAYRYFSLDSYNNAVAILGLFIVFFFLMKSYLIRRMQAYIFSISYKQEAALSMRLMRKYMSAPYTFHLNQSSSHVLHVVISVVKKVSLGVLVPLLTCISNLVLFIAISTLLFL